MNVPPTQPIDAPKQKPMISVIDDDASVRRAVSRLIRSASLDVVAYESAEDFIADEGVSGSDCLILDLHLPGKDGLQLQSELAAAGSRCPIVFITAFDDDKARTQALEAGASDFLLKPIDSERLIDAVRTALRSA